MVVNQWHVVTQMYIDLTNWFSIIYFYSYYLISVMIVVNVVIAFVVDAFITQYSRVQDLESQDPIWEQRIREALSLVFPLSSSHWIVRRKENRALFYDGLFGNGDVDNAE